MVLFFDMTLIPISYYLAYMLRFNFDLASASAAMRLEHLMIILPAFLFFFWKTKSYSGILRHSTSRDVIHILTATLFTGLLLIFIILMQRISNGYSILDLPVSVAIIMVMIVSTLMVSSRLTVKIVYQKLKESRDDKTSIMIFGAGELGLITGNTLLSDKSMNIKLVGFIDDNVSLQNKYSAGIPVYSPEKAFSRIIPENDVKEVIFAIDQARISYKRKREITDECIKHRLAVKEIPPVKTWINGELQTQAIRRINIEDLLGRDAIQLDREKIEAGLKDSVVLVTGAAGSIGSEIVRQLIAFKVKQVIMLDNAESDLYDLEQEILAQKSDIGFKTVVADVANIRVLSRIFQRYKPSIVFNAAAYKHVPLMEKYPGEAIRVNVGGTKNLADLSVEFGVEKFVYISTDKAVNPSSVMGATKRIGEIYIQSLAQSEKINTRFITTRFGNVLGSNGSVVPLFKKQIERGGPVTVTHKDITRYFMTIPEACQLVLEAGFMGNGGEIYVFDMGEPVRIYDLARKMISLSGLEPDKDIEIRVTSLRPGEKLFEELLDNREGMVPTHNEKIMIAKVRKHRHSVVNKHITDLLVKVDDMDDSSLVRQIKSLVPEFRSENSSNQDSTRKPGNGQEVLSGYHHEPKDFVKFLGIL
jgi:FlaA1/EpsC-like NDP-sugar epimerase